jgi:hypothetical protein
VCGSTDLGVEGLKVLGAVVVGANLRRADKGPVQGVEDEHDILGVEFEGRGWDE